jgi:AraC-like DNA-binding protein
MLHHDTLLRLCQARDRLCQAGEGALPVRYVAADLGMSQFHFIRLFKAVFGETPKQCQVRARMDRAKQLLMLTDTSVTDICLEVGFSSLGTFSAAFARRVGLPPSSYRGRVRPMVVEPGVMPREFAPGCLSLMGGSGQGPQDSRSSAGAR